MGRIVSVDYGIVRIGLAISDERKCIATSLGMIAAQKTAEGNVKVLLDALKTYSVDALIIGMPLHMNGKMGFLADEVKHFIACLQKHVSFPVVAWDERLSTVQAERALREAELSRKKRSKVIDGVAAVILLQSYLSFLDLQAERKRSESDSLV